MGLDVKKLEMLLTQMLTTLQESNTAVEEPPKKKRGRPKGSTKKVTAVKEPNPVPEPEVVADGQLHQIKKKGPDDRRKPLPGQMNLFNPADYKTCEDEGTAEWKRLKDGGIVKSQKREAYKSCKCEDCGKSEQVLIELSRENYVCDRCMDSKIPRSE
jgi:hypothetical protein